MMNHCPLFNAIRSSLLLPALLALSLGAANSALGQFLYDERFDNATAANQLVGTVGWTAYRGNSATTSMDPSAGDRAAISSSNGNPTGDGPGYLFTSNATTGTINIAAVTTFAAITPSEITWKMGNASTNVAVRLLVQVDGNWYASDDTFSTTAFTLAQFQSSAVTRTFDFSTLASEWRSFTLNPGTSMSLGSVLASDLPSSQITGVGFFSAHTAFGSTARIDTLQIVPEPSGGVLILMGVASGCIAFRRRKNIA